jgi:hypothetical protein
MYTGHYIHHIACYLQYKYWLSFVTIFFSDELLLKVKNFSQAIGRKQPKNAEVRLELQTQIQLAQNLNSLRRGGDEKLMTMP